MFSKRLGLGVLYLLALLLVRKYMASVYGLGLTWKCTVWQGAIERLKIATTVSYRKVAHEVILSQLICILKCNLLNIVL